MPLMMWFHRSKTGKLSRPLPFRSLSRRSLKKRHAAMRHITWKRKNLPSTPINPSIARKPAWMLGLAPGIYRQPGNRPDGKFLAGAQRDISTVRFTVKLRCIPTIDLDRSRQTVAISINDFGTFSDRSRYTPIDLESYSHSIVNSRALLRGKARCARPSNRPDTDKSTVALECTSSASLHLISLIKRSLGRSGYEVGIFCTPVTVSTDRSGVWRRYRSSS